MADAIMTGPGPDSPPGQAPTSSLSLKSDPGPGDPEGPPPGRGIRLIRIVLLLVVLAMLGTGVAVTVLWFAIDYRTESKSFTQTVKQVRVSTGTGDITVRAGLADGPAEVISRTTSAFVDARFTAVVKEGVLEVSGSCSRSAFGICTVHLEVVVPPGTTVEARTDTGDVEVSGLGASVVAATDTGDVRVQDTRGTVRLSTSTGDVDGAGMSGGTVSAGTDTGDVDLAFSTAPDAVTASTDTGDVRMRFGTAPGNVVARTDTGDVEVEVPDDATAYRILDDVGTGESRIDVADEPASDRVINVTTDTGDISVTSGGRRT